MIHVVVGLLTSAPTGSGYAYCHKKAGCGLAFGLG